MRRHLASPFLLILGVTVLVAGLVAVGFTSRANADTVYSTTTYVDAGGETDTLVQSFTDPVTVSNTFTTSATDDCYRRSATGKMVSHIGATLLTFTSFNVSCINRAKTKVTYYHWETPSHTVTSAGQLAGWQWDYWSRNKNRVSACLVSGTSSGHFVQKYPVIGTIGNATIRQHLDVWCKGASWS